MRARLAWSTYEGRCTIKDQPSAGEIRGSTSRRLRGNVLMKGLLAMQSEELHQLAERLKLLWTHFVRQCVMRPCMEDSRCIGMQARIMVAFTSGSNGHWMEPNDWLTSLATWKLLAFWPESNANALPSDGRSSYLYTYFSMLWAICINST